MNYLDILINRVEIMFIIIILGFVLRRTNFIDDSITRTMGDIMLKIITPLTIFGSFITEYSIEKVKLLLISIVASIAIHVIAIVVATVAFTKEQRIEKFATAVGNVGFFGLAVAISTCGTEAAFFGAAYSAIDAFFFWTYGAYIMSGDKSLIKPINVIKNFDVLAFALGLVFFFLGLNIPQVFKDTISSLSNINSPVCGLIIGVGLASCSFEKIKSNLKSFTSLATRLIIVPILSALVLKLIPNDYYAMKVTLMIVASVPVASAATIFATVYKQDVSKASMIVSMSTLLCVLTMPLMTKLAFIIWGI